MRSFNYFATVLATAVALTAAAPSSPSSSSTSFSSSSRPTAQIKAAVSSTASTSCVTIAKGTVSCDCSTQATSTSKATPHNIIYRQHASVTVAATSTSSSRASSSSRTSSSARTTSSAPSSTKARQTTSSSSPSSTSSSASPAPTNELDGFYFGANSYFLHALERSDRIAVLDAMKSAGMSVLRIFIGHVYENNKNSGNAELMDLEPYQLGQYDDTILKRIDILMYEASQRNIKLIIACGDRYALGYWDTDIYAQTYGIAEWGSSGDQRISDASVFYTDNGAMTFYDKRIDHIMQHKNEYMGGKTWAELDSVIYAMEAQNEPMGHMAFASSSWSCDRAGRIKQNLPAGSGILISTGGGITIDTSLDDWAWSCDNFDIISVHDYGTNAWTTAAALAAGQQKAWDQGKTLLFEEWGALGANKAAIIKQFAQALQQYSIPWLYWEITKPGQGSNDFEVWTNEDSWGVLGDGNDTGAINWSKRSLAAGNNKKQKRSSAPALDMPAAPTAAQRFAKRLRQHNKRKVNQLVRGFVSS